MGHRRVLLVLSALAGALALPSAAAAAEPPLGLACTPQNGVRFCPSNGTTQRFKSFDGVPLDVDVTLPASGDGPFPTIVMLHGYGGSKTSFETTSEDPSATSGALYRWNNNSFAKQGYAVVNSTARGFGASCGTPPSRLADPTGCARGWIHLIDHRFEIRDTQEILGALVDQGVTRPNAIGVTGISYGGGQSMILATLKDKVRNPDGSFKPWTSPKGTPLSIAAAWPRWPWSDLVHSLVPNGRYRDDRIAGPNDSRSPFGVGIQSYLAGLYSLGQTTGYYAPPGTDPAADITTWFAEINAGEPYEGNPRIKALADEIYSNHGAYALMDGVNGPPGNPIAPAPLLIENGFTDDLFPIGEALKVYNRLRQVQGTSADVAVQFGDLGHARGQNKRDVDVALNTQGVAFLAKHVKGEDSAAVPPKGSATVYTQTCPKEAPAGGPILAPSWEATHPGALAFADAASQTVTSAGGDPSKASATDPIGGQGACAKVSGSDDPGTAVYRLGESRGFTMIGRPAVSATVALTGATGQLVARLWDVGSDGRQTLVTRQVYRLNPGDGKVDFQLNGNGYTFAAGNTPKLELVGSSAPTYRKSNGEFQVAVSGLKLVIPTLEKPGAAALAGPNGKVLSPAAAAAAGAGSSGSSSTKRKRPRRIVVRVSPRRGDTRGARRFTTTGRILLPKGLTRRQACNGRVTVQVKAGRRTVSLRRARVTSKCAFRSRVTFTNTRRFAGRKKLRFTVRFQGNKVLLQRKAKSVLRRVR